MKIEDKIKKLLALSNSPNQNEAELAMMKVQELLTKHNLELSEINTEENKTEQEEIETFKKDTTWKLILRNGISKALLCINVTNYRRIENKYVFYSVFIGKKINIIVAKQMYDYIVGVVNRISKNSCKGHGRAYANTFRLAMVKSIVDRLIKKHEEKKDYGDGKWGIIVANEEKQLLRWSIQNGYKHTNYRSTNRNDYHANQNGAKAGNNVSLNSQISGGSSQRLIS